MARILIVEDEGIVAMELAARIEAMGHEVCATVGSVADALAVIEAASELPDLALLDMRLRGPGDGCQLARELRERHDIPFIFLTAYSDGDTLGQIKACEPLGYLLKPFDERTLWVTVETALHTHAATRARVEAERQLRRTDAQYAAILDQSHDAVLSIDCEQRITVFNRGAQRVFGYAAEEVLGQPLSMLLPQEEHENHTRLVEHFRDAGGHGVGRRMGVLRPVRGRRKDGSVFPADVSITRLQLEGETVMTAIARDMTTPRAIEQRLVQSERLEAIGRLAGGIAHDFNNLLTGILGYSRILQRALPVDSPLADDVAEIRTAGERASELVRELLAYSRRQALEPRAIDLNAALEGLRRMLLTLLSAEIELVFELDPELPAVLADPAKLEQVVMNLVLNARDAMPERGVITVRTGREAPADAERLDVAADRWVSLHVTDTGVGMDETTCAHVFEPFFSTKGGRGTGLGLATSYGTVRQSGGTMTVDSSPGQGSTFVVHLPATRQVSEAPSRRRQSVSDHPSVGSRRRILLVDDEPIIRELGGRLLEAEGYEVVVAASGDDAWKRVIDSDAGFDLLLTDVVMPGLNGYELAERWRDRFPEAPILMMSGYAEEHLDKGVTVNPVRSLSWLEKPFEPSTLASTVARLLDSTPPAPV
ncbi:MAG: response regulator [Myxococcales bacterium]|nr:response regulator [Myxococcales bacterium]